MILPGQPALRIASVGPEVGDRQALAERQPVEPQIVMIGEAPSPTSDPSDPFAGRPLRWLSWILKLSEEEVRSRMSFVNLLDRYPGRRFPIAEGRLAAEKLAIPKRGTWLLAGRAVGLCFGRRRSEMFRWFYLSDVRAAVVPHPSGLNRWWNDPANRERYAEFIRTVLDPDWVPQP